MKPTRVFFIADDDADDQELFISALKEVDESCHCITAANGEDALRQLAEHIYFPDIIFLDLNMPRMNGKQCLKEIKLNSALAHIPVIIYSTSAENKEVHEVTEMGAAYFLQKPNRFNDLCSALGQIVAKNWDGVS